MSATAPGADAARLMDRMYRFQRHIYDATRKFYLLGRDGLIDGLAPPPGAAVLEIGCGTGRNLILIARRWPGTRCYGLDVSAEMLETARRNIARAGLSERIQLAQADATAFDAQALFGRPAFERVVISYALSMIPPWRAVLPRALAATAPGGSLHIVDFGDRASLPRPLARLLDRWLGLFHVTPRDDLGAVLADEARGFRARCEHRQLLRGYAVHARVLLPPAAGG